MDIDNIILEFNEKNKDTQFYSNKTMEDKFVYFIYGDEPNLNFLEAGASDGITNSMTYFLEKNLNWRGICIEPSNCFEECKKNRNHVQKILLGSTEEEKLFLIFNDFNNELSCKIENLIKLYKHDTWQRKFIIKGDLIKPLLINQTTISSILNTNQIEKLNFLGLDLESGELDALTGIDFTKHSIDLITCENYEVVSFLKSKNYVELYNPFVIDNCHWNSWFASYEFIKNKSWLKCLSK